MIYGNNDDGDNANIYRLTRRRRATSFTVVYILPVPTRRDKRKEGKENYKRNILSTTYLDVIPTSSFPLPL